MKNPENIKTRFVPVFSAFKIKINHFVLSVLMIGITALFCAPLSNLQSYYIVSFILLFVVSFMATFMETAPVLLASTLAALVWNFFFIPPRNTFHIDKAEDILMFGMFFIIALLNGILTTRVRRQEKLALEREKRTNALFQLTRGLSKASGIREVTKVAIQYIKDYFQEEAFFILQDGNNKLHVSSGFQKENAISAEEVETAQWVFEHSSNIEKTIKNKTTGSHTFYLLSGAKINPGVMAVKLEKQIGTDRKQFWDTCLAQIANALEREFLGELAQKARFLDESDRLYKTLFNSISHELRIPVATILGSVDTLLAASHPENVQTALHEEIFTASLRLNRLIENLLNMSRLESGRISVRLDWYDMNDLVNKVAGDLHEELQSFQFSVSVPDDMPLVKIDFGLMEQVLYNLLFNACEYAPESTIIELRIFYKDEELVVEISDRGPGFPLQELKNVFNKFFRVDGRKTGGLGLGLSIVKGFVEAHKGTIAVANRKGGGALFTVKIPSGNTEIDKLKLDEI